MKILGLPGRDESSFSWLKDILAVIELPGAEKKAQYYEHWRSEGAGIDASLEIGRAAAYKPDLIVGKSLGSVGTLLGVSMGALNPGACILIGVPVLEMQQQELDVLAHWPANGIPTLIIQQTAGRTGGYPDLLEKITPAGACVAIEVTGDDHLYSDIDEMGQIMNSWLKRIDG